MGALFNCLNKRLGCEKLGSLENEGLFFFLEGGGRVRFPIVSWLSSAGTNLCHK